MFLESSETVIAAITLLGGLGLFIFGMNMMTDGLRSAAGGRIRAILSAVGCNRANGMLAGIAMGATIQTSAATVLLLGLINAGIMTLPESVAPMLGANIGTTLAMYVISLRVGDLCFLGIAAGMLLHLAGKNTRAAPIGLALLGFGLLFLGMNIMSGAVRPFKTELTPLLSKIDGSTAAGMLTGAAVAACVTAVIQSSGATIALVFSLIAAGAITSLEQSYPIIIGANVGTCITALLAGIGADIEARRSAVSHLVFNLVSAAFGILTAGIAYRLIPLTSQDLVRQTANANTFKMAITALAVLPLAGLHIRLVRLLTPTRETPREPSRLDESLLDRPENALAAVIRELRRSALICVESLNTAAGLIRGPDRRAARRVTMNEQAIDEIKLSTRRYLQRMTSRYMSRRQAILLQHLNNAMVNIERIHDHIEAICSLSAQRGAIPGACFDQTEDIEQINGICGRTARILETLARSLDADRNEFAQAAREILESRAEQITLTRKAIDAYTSLVSRHERRPICGMFFTEYVSAFSRIGRHCAEIAVNQGKPEFRLKPSKLGKTTPPAPESVAPASVKHDEIAHWIFREKTNRADDEDD